MTKSSEDQNYEIDEDGYRREIVGPWVRDKHSRLERYIGISRAVRARFIGPGKAGATYVDLFSGPGRVRVRDELSAFNGSPAVAWEQAALNGAGFTEMHIADLDPENSQAVEARLSAVGAPIYPEIGPALETVDRIVSKLNPYGLHFAFLDPYNLESLDFRIIQRLASLKRMDILIHVSIQDMQRNLQRYIESETSPLDAFAPGWRNHIGTFHDPKSIRSRILGHWRNLLKAEGMDTTEQAELVVGTKKQRLYLLAFAARHERALEFWEKVRDVEGNKQLGLQF